MLLMLNSTMVQSERTLDGDEVIIMGIQLTGQDLVDKFVKHR